MTIATQHQDCLRIVLASWAPFLAGAEVAAERLALGLVAAGHEVVVILGTKGAALERMRSVGLRCRYVPVRFTDKFKWLSYRSARAAWAKVLREERPDVVHSNDLPTSQIVSDAARRLGIPRVCHHRWIFDGPAIDWFNKYGAETHLFVSRALMNDLCGKSQRLAAYPRAVVHDGLPLPRVPMGNDRLAARRRLGLGGDKHLVLFAGQIIERKGVADLIRGWASLKHWHDLADLVIVGDDLEGGGAYRQQMETLAAETGSPARFAGFQKDVGQWLTAADIVMVPSHAEPLGNATLEAMAHARPVIGGDVGGIPEMIMHEETGLLIPPSNPAILAAALARLLTDEAYRERLGAAARQRCEEHFSLEAHVAAVVGHYQTVVRPSATHRKQPVVIS